MFAAGSGEQQFWGSIGCEMGLKLVIEVNWRREACARVRPGIQIGWRRMRARARTRTSARVRTVNDFIIFRQMHISGAQGS